MFIVSILVSNKESGADAAAVRVYTIVKELPVGQHVGNYDCAVKG